MLASWWTKPFLMGCFGDGVPWEKVPVRFPAFSALLGENQESLETLSKAVWSRDRAQLGFSELPAKTEILISYLSSAAVSLGLCNQHSLQPELGCFLRSLGLFAAARMNLPSPEISVMIITAVQILLLIVF